MRGALAALFIVTTTPLLAQSFDLTTDEARQKINKQIKDDNGDGLNKCKQVQQDLACKPDDTSFRKSVKSFSKLTSVNVRFELKENVTFVPAKGKLQNIVMEGDRDNPMGLFHFIGQVGSVMKALDPEMGDDRFQEAASNLGLMRVDGDPSTSGPQVHTTKVISVSCVSQSAGISTKIECKLGPRP